LASSSNLARVVRAKPLHPVDRPEQVHGGGSAGRQVIAGLGKLARLRADDATVRGTDADRRRAAHAETLDRAPHRFNIPAVEPDLFGRQLGLIEQSQVTGGRVALPQACVQSVRAWRP
jgi:hypothetical protein